MMYQARFSGGATIGTGRRDVERRYAAIEPHIRPGSHILDFGSERGYFAHRLAAERECSVVAVDPKAEARSHVWAIHEKLGPAGIRTLGAFHAALVLSVLHHCVPWRAHLEALWVVAPTLFIETPHPDEVLRRVPHERVVEIYEHIMGLVDGGAEIICRVGGVYAPDILRPTVMVHTR